MLNSTWKSQKALAALSPVRRFRVLPKDAQTYEIRWECVCVGGGSYRQPPPEERAPTVIISAHLNSGVIRRAEQKQGQHIVLQTLLYSAERSPGARLHLALNHLLLPSALLKPASIYVCSPFHRAQSDPWWWLRRPAGRPGSAAVVQINLIWIKRHRLSARLLDATLTVPLEKHGGGIVEAKLKQKNPPLARCWF